ncbi:dynein regulatory complex protein 8 isoform X20 [Rattus norvegicus]|uniref:dynein regulatory complex protein 8 isoform X20 n=1 Tax=Rattus norvegicus TaxID=10116 RepID=UPI002FD7CB11
MTPLGPKNAGLSSWGVGRRPPRVEGLPPPRPPRAARRVCDGISQATGSAPRWRRKRTRRVQVEEEEPTGYIRFEKFIPVMTTVLLEKRYRPIAEDVLLRAFEVLDPTKRGFLTKDELVKYMTEEGQRALFLASLFPKRKWKKCCLLQLILNQTPLITETT